MSIVATATAGFRIMGNTVFSVRKLKHWTIGSIHTLYDYINHTHADDNNMSTLMKGAADIFD